MSTQSHLSFLLVCQYKLKKLHGILSSDYTWIIDSNIIFKDNLIDNFINLSKNKVKMITPFVICQSNKNHYYDTFAFISKNNISYKDTSNTCLFKNCSKCNHECHCSKELHADEYGVCTCEKCEC